MLYLDENGNWTTERPLYGAHNPHPDYLNQLRRYAETGNPDYYREDGSYVPAGTRPSSPSFVDKTAKVLVETMALLGMGAGAAGMLGAGGAVGAGAGAGATAGAAEAGAGAGLGEAAGAYGGMDAAAVAGADYGSALGGSSGGGMWDYMDGSLYDEWSPAAVGDSYGGSTYYDPAWADEWSPEAVGDAYGGASTGGGGIMDYLKTASLAKSLLGGVGGASSGRGILDGILGDPSGAAFNSLPFILALTEANRQENTVAPILARTNALTESINPEAVRSAALGPYNRETASGLDRLTSSLTSRGVMGSSFGDASIADFKTARDVGAGELGTKAALGAVGTSGALLDQILRGTNAMNANRNLMLGAGLNASGRLFEPQRDPFGLRNLLGAI